MPETLIDKLTSKDEWIQDLDIALPINGSDIPYFREWINWNGWKGNCHYHTAFDFASYFTGDGKCILGLPRETPVRAIADGIVKQVSHGLAGSGVPYACFINIEHGKEESGLFSAYHHVVPLVKDGKEVKKGDVVAILYKDAGNEEGKLVHLHFEMSHGWDVKDRKVDPVSLFPQIEKYRAEPQGSKNFQISDLSEQPEISIANFKELLVDI